MEPESLSVPDGAPVPPPVRPPDVPPPELRTDERAAHHAAPDPDASGAPARPSGEPLSPGRESLEREAAYRRGEERERAGRAGRAADDPSADGGPAHVPGVGVAHPAVVARAFAALAEGVRDYAIFLMDPDGIVTYWGESARLIKWWTKAQVEGGHLRMLYPDGGAEDGAAEAHLDEAARTGEYVGEGQRVRSDGSTFWAGVALTALRDADGTLLGFAKVTRDLTAHRAAEAALRAAEAAEAARREAEAASRAKSEFLATMSHEIRTPINAILGYADLLAAGIGGPLADVQRDYVERTRSSGRHLALLVEDVLDLSRIEANRVTMRPTAGRAGDAVRGALDTVAPQADAAGVRLVDAVSGHAADVAYWGDEGRVRQVLINLIGNAVKFTAPGGLITVSAGTAAQPAPDAQVTRVPGAGLGTSTWAYLRVEDSGTGIDPERLEAMFEPFVQAESGHTRRHGGTGLGLTISRRLARLMGGDITARSTPGLGSTLFVWLPAAPADAVVADADGRRATGHTGGSRFATAATARHIAAPPDQGASREAPLGTLGDVADAITAELELILEAFVERLRHDPETPSAHALEREALEDHLATFLADVAQTLAAPELVADAPAESQRDGAAIQRLIAERHGAQRARLGWAEAEVRHEYAILGDELARALRRRPPRGPTPEARAREAERAVGALRQFLERAADVSVARFRDALFRADGRRAVQTGGPTPGAPATGAPTDVG